MKNKRVVVGLSGGVDSSVCAYLLKEQGYEVIGIFMRNWHDESVVLNNECPWIDDSNDAMLVAEKLEIPFHVLDLSREYKERIVDYMFSEYENGRTPNPDVLCNREIKFDIFLDAAMRLNADYVATGHYCQRTETTENGKTTFHLLAGADKNKDQSYFLCQLSQEQLSKALFPIGHLQKSEVRAIATEQQLVTADKKDSQGLCFVGKISLPDFLQQQLQPKKGRIVEIPTVLEQYLVPVTTEPQSENDIFRSASQPYSYSYDMGKDKGEHNGAHYYTIGQRKGLGVGGSPEPLFIIGTDVKENVVYVGQGETHPGLNRLGLRIPAADIHWIREDLALSEGQTLRCEARIRYRQLLEAVTLKVINGDLYLLFDNKQRGIAPGQFAAFYVGEELVGSGVIS
ncbi:MAG: tRNA 2-thiouridine(34) synthase MnmA [Bacteroidota bacterium]